MSNGYCDELISAGAAFHRAVIDVAHQKKQRSTGENTALLQAAFDRLCVDGGMTDFRVEIRFDDVHRMMGKKWHTELAYIQTQADHVIINFHDLLLIHPEPHAGLIFVAKSWVLIAILHVINQVNNALPKAAFVFEIGDGGTLGHVCFTSTRPGACLILDYDFALSNGYKQFRELSSSRAVPWEKRSGQVFWRGSTTGARTASPFLPDGSPDTSFRWLQRLQLSALAQTPGLRELCDVGITAIVQIPESELRQSIQDAGLVKAKVQREAFMLHKAVIDIDGNANAWSGLFCSLLGGSVVLKVGSPPNNVHSQWYYDNLIPWLHFVPVRFDFTDLRERIDWVLTNDLHAKEIALRGAEYARSITFSNALETSAAKLTHWLNTRHGESNLLNS